MFIIIKLVLDTLFTILFAPAIFKQRAGASNKTMLILYILCFTTAGGLGYSGGELVYG